MAAREWAPSSCLAVLHLEDRRLCSGLQPTAFQCALGSCLQSVLHGLQQMRRRRLTLNGERLACARGHRQVGHTGCAASSGSSATDIGVSIIRGQGRAPPAAGACVAAATLLIHSARGGVGTARAGAAGRSTRAQRCKAVRGMHGSWGCAWDCGPCPQPRLGLQHRFQHLWRVAARAWPCPKPDTERTERAARSQWALAGLCGLCSALWCVPAAQRAALRVWAERCAYSRFA